MNSNYMATPLSKPTAEELIERLNSWYHDMPEDCADRVVCDAAIAALDAANEPLYARLVVPGQTYRTLDTRSGEQRRKVQGFTCDRADKGMTLYRRAGYSMAQGRRKGDA